MPPSCSPLSVVEFVRQTPLETERNTLILRTVYIFVGSVIMAEGWYHWIPGTLVALIGIGYVGLEFVPSIEPPANMR